MNYNQGGSDSTTRQMSMVIHLTQLLGHTALPVLGWAVPLVLWQVKKSELPGVDVHGKNVANWMLTELILGAIFGFLCIFLIGIPLLIALYVLGIVFPIIGGIKANNGEVWEYPLSFKFFK